VQLLDIRWPAPPGVRAALTLRHAGASPAPWSSLNLGSHVGDAPANVAANRAAVYGALHLPAEPLWLQQVHGARVADADLEPLPLAAADAAVSRAAGRAAGRVLAILVADCLPVLFTSADGGVIAAAHAGWRGLAVGVLENTVRAMGIPAARVHAWLGPAIGPQHFEVGDEVRAAFMAHDAAAAPHFTRNARGRWQCDLMALARQRLRASGVASLHGDAHCTYADGARFFSFRRDGQCGRMAALIWRERA
jgi:YfiH family protein